MKENRKLIFRESHTLIDRSKSEDDPLDIDLLIEKLKLYKKEFDSFELDYDKDWDGYIEEISIICKSYETDEEYELRRNNELEISLHNQRKEKEQEQKAIETRKQLYEELKKEFEK